MSGRNDTRRSRGRRLIAAIGGRVRDHRGFMLIEVLIAAGLMIVVLSASLLTFELLITNQGIGSTRYESQDKARNMLDRLARDLRNVSGASTGAQEIDQAHADDLIFRTVNPVGPPSSQNATNIQRVRYCIDTTNHSVLWYQAQTWSGSTVPSYTTSGCPDSTPGVWNGQTQYADAITNYANSQTRPLFSFTTSSGAIIAVHAELYVNAKPGGVAAETHLSSGVFLRNQDVPPTAAFTATAGSSRITLDGSSSFSPQGSTLTYQWYDTIGGSTYKVGGGIVFTYQTDPVTHQPLTGTHLVSLKVFDPASLEGDAAAQSVTVQ